MTISYTGRFGKLLFRWKASLWKNIWREAVVFIVLHYFVAFVYRVLLNDAQQRTFASISLNLHERAAAAVPMAFLLGNYVVTVVKRWWEQFENVSWPDEFLFLVSAHIRDKGESKRFLRRNIARYCIATAVLSWRNISARVLKRFPTAEHLSESGLMTEAECKLYRETEAPYGRWFIPLNWIQSEILKLEEDKELTNQQAMQLLTSLDAYRRKFIRLFVCDWISIPLAYTQLATITTYSYFLVTLIAHQELKPEHIDGDKRGHRIDMYLPISSLMQFILYIGWLKVAEKLIHPFGEEDDDFELNYIIDRHLFIGMMIVDGQHGSRGPNIRDPDPFWETGPYLPHTKASQRVTTHDPRSKSHGALPFDEMALLTSVPSVAAHLTHSSRQSSEQSNGHKRVNRSKSKEPPTRTVIGAKINEDVKFTM